MLSECARQACYHVTAAADHTPRQTDPIKINLDVRGWLWQTWQFLRNASSVGTKNKHMCVQIYFPRWCGWIVNFADPEEYTVSEDLHPKLHPNPTSTELPMFRKGFCAQVHRTCVGMKFMPIMCRYKVQVWYEAHV